MTAGERIQQPRCLLWHTGALREPGFHGAFLHHYPKLPDKIQACRGVPVETLLLSIQWQQDSLDRDERREDQAQSLCLLLVMGIPNQQNKNHAPTL